MPITVSCQCGQKFAAPDQLAGKSGKCPACKGPITVPSAAEATKPASAAGKTPPGGAPSPTPVKVFCGACGQGFAAPAKMIGKTIPCPGCKQPLVITADSKPRAPKHSANPADAVESLLSEEGIGRKAGPIPPGYFACPGCFEPMPRNAILCVKCGYHREKQKKIETKRR